MENWTGVRFSTQILGHKVTREPVSRMGRLATVNWMSKPRSFANRRAAGVERPQGHARCLDAGEDPVNSMSRARDCLKS